MNALAVAEAAPPLAPPAGVPRQAETDAQLVDLCLFGRSPHTQRAYRREIARFLAHPALAGKPLLSATLGDVQAFAAALAAADVGLRPTSQARALAAVKSLLALEPDPRHRALLRLAYAGGLRVSELVALRWRDLQPRGVREGGGEAGQVTVYGKGGKTRTALLPAPVWADLLALRGPAGVEGERDADAPVFRSRKGKGGWQGLRVRQAQRLVDAAARRAGLRAGVSPHWLRHAHATHALERGAPIHLVAATLGHASVATTGKYLHARPTDSSSRYLAL